MSSTASTWQSMMTAAAEYYLRLGYTVNAHTTKSDLPEFVKSFRPDFIAIRGSDKRLVVVKSRLGGTSKRVPDSLFKQLEGHPEWMVEYYYVKGREDVSEPIEESNTLTARIISERTKEARSLLLEGHREAAFVLVWSVLESILRNFAAKRRLGVRAGAEAISAELVATGYLDNSHHRLFQKVVPVRNALVHGFQSPEIEKDTVLELIDLVPVLQRELAASRRARARAS